MDAVQAKTSDVHWYFLGHILYNFHILQFPPFYLLCHPLSRPDPPYWHWFLLTYCEEVQFLDQSNWVPIWASTYRRLCSSPPPLRPLLTRQGVLRTKVSTLRHQRPWNSLHKQTRATSLKLFPNGHLLPQPLSLDVPCSSPMQDAHSSYSLVLTKVLQSVGCPCFLTWESIIEAHRHHPVKPSGEKAVLFKSSLLAPLKLSRRKLGIEFLIFPLHLLIIPLNKSGTRSLCTALEGISIWSNVNTTLFGEV